MPKSPLFRLVSLTLLVLVLGLVGLGFLRWLGSQQTYTVAPHPWMQKRTWLLARMSPEDCSQVALQQLLELDEKWTIWLDVQPFGESLEVVCPTSRIFELSSEIKRGPKLERVIPLLQKRGVVFNVRTIDTSVTSPFLQLVQAWDKKSDVGIASSSQSFLRDMRKKRPDWLFAGDASTWTKLQFFSSFGVESALDLWQDFFVASSRSDEPNFLTGPAAKEIALRKKVLILELEEQKAIGASWQPLIRGVLTTRPKNFSADTFFIKTGAE